jgi:predicted ATPase
LFGVSLRAEVSRPFVSTIFPQAIADEEGPLPTRVVSSPLRLRNLSISNYRIVEAAHFDFVKHPISVLIGPNQSGKSSVLDALDLASRMSSGELGNALGSRGGFQSIVPKGSPPRTSPEFTFEAATPEGQVFRYAARVSGIGSHDYEVSSELMERRISDSEFAVVFRREGQRIQVGQAASWHEVPASYRECVLSKGSALGPEADQMSQTLSAIAVFPYFNVGAAWATDERGSLRAPGRIEPGARLHPTGANLVSALFALKAERPEDFAQLTEVLRLCFPRFVSLEFPAVSLGVQRLVWNDSGGSFDASQLSDGTLALIALATALLDDQSSVVAIDEPEQHLHPMAMLRLIGLVESVGVKHPVVLATQSDTLVGLMDENPESIAVMQNTTQGSSMIRPSIDELAQWMKRFSLRELRRDLESWGAPGDAGTH